MIDLRIYYRLDNNKLKIMKFIFTHSWALIAWLLVWITWNAKYTYKMGTFSFDDGNMMKVRFIEDNSLTYEFYLPQDGTIRVSTVLGDGSKDSFVLSLNNTNVTLLNYIQTSSKDVPMLKDEGEYLLIQKDFKQRTFKIRKYINNSEVQNATIPINGRFIVEYINEAQNSINSVEIIESDIIYFAINQNTRELRRLKGNDNSDSLKYHGIGLYVAWTLLSYLMLITGRYMKVFYWWRMILHTILGIVILILTIIFVSMADGVGNHTNTFFNIFEIWSFRA